MFDNSNFLAKNPSSGWSGLNRIYIIFTWVLSCLRAGFTLVDQCIIPLSILRWYFFEYKTLRLYCIKSREASNQELGGLSLPVLYIQCWRQHCLAWLLGKRWNLNFWPPEGIMRKIISHLVPLFILSRQQTISITWVNKLLLFKTVTEVCWRS